MSPRSRLNLHLVFQFLWIEAAFAFAYDLWIGPVYLSGLAGELSLPIGIVTLLTALPFIGSAGQLIGVWAFNRVHSVKHYCIGLIAIARGLWILPLLLALMWSPWIRGEGHFPVAEWARAVALIACLSALLASSSSVAWLSWMRELVPEDFQGRFFGIRQRFTMIALIAANLIAAAWVGWKPGGIYAGYAVIGLLAVTAGALSVYFLSRVPDRALHRDPTLKGFKPYRIPLHDRRYLRFLLFSGAFQGCFQLSGPYFPYYFTKELSIPMSQVSIWTALTALGSMLAAGFWGARLDRTHSPRKLIWMTGHLIAFSPIVYTFLPNRWVSIYAPLDYFFSGVINSGYVLAIVALLFRLAPAKGSMYYFSLYTASQGLFGALFTYLGGTIARELVALGGFKALWVITTCVRLAILWTLFRWMIFPVRDSSGQLATVEH